VNGLQRKQLLDMIEWTFTKTEIKKFCLVLGVTADAAPGTTKGEMLLSLRAILAKKTTGNVDTVLWKKFFETLSTHPREKVKYCVEGYRAFIETMLGEGYTVPEDTLWALASEAPDSYDYRYSKDGEIIGVVGLRGVQRGVSVEAEDWTEQEAAPTTQAAEQPTPTPLMAVPAIGEPRVHQGVSQPTPPPRQGVSRPTPPPRVPTPAGDLFVMASLSTPEMKKAIADLQQSLGKGESMPTNKVFLVHGRDNEVKQTVARFLEHLGFDPIILHEKPGGGRTIIEKIEHYGKGVEYAVVLLAPDDEGHLRDSSEDYKPRARQNVIFELGYFIGKLGRGRVSAIKVGDDIEGLSDFGGVEYIPWDAHDGWQKKLARELVAAGFSVDTSALLR
jgi:predicted nucleotide-binding protein